MLLISDWLSTGLRDELAERRGEISVEVEIRRSLSPQASIQRYLSCHAAVKEQLPSTVLSSAFVNTTAMEP